MVGRCRHKDIISTLFISYVGVYIILQCRIQELLLVEGIIPLSSSIPPLPFPSFASPSHFPLPSAQLPPRGPYRCLLNPVWKL